MKRVSERISIEEEKSKTRIEISAQIESWKRSLLISWLAAWTFCGVVVGTQLFGELSRELLIAVVVYISFWAYFEYKIAYAVLWRLFGKEIIEVEGGMMRVKRDIKGYGKVVQYFKENINRMRLMEDNAKSFAQTFNKSFWVVGGEQIVFESLGASQGFGLQLEREEAKKLLQYLRRKI